MEESRGTWRSLEYCEEPGGVEESLGIRSLKEPGGVWTTAGIWRSLDDPVGVWEILREPKGVLKNVEEAGDGGDCKSLNHPGGTWGSVEGSVGGTWKRLRNLEVPGGACGNWRSLDNFEELRGIRGTWRSLEKHEGTWRSLRNLEES